MPARKIKYCDKLPRKVRGGRCGCFAQDGNLCCGRSVAEVAIWEDSEIGDGRWFPMRVCLLHGGAAALNELKRDAAAQAAAKKG